MIGLVLVTHGHLASEFRSALEHVVGPQDQIETVTINPNDNVEMSRKEIIEAVHKVDKGDGVVILTDMFGGTPTNLSLSFLEADKVEIITGVNLPMLIKLFSLRKEKWNLVEAAQKIRAQGQKSIHVASDILNRS